MTEQLLSPSPQETQNAEPAAIEFVFCEHTVEYVPQIVEKLSSAEVVAIELVGGSVTERDHLLTLANNVTHNRIGTTELEKSLADLEAYFGPQHEEFFPALIEGISGSGTTIYFVDAASGTEEYEADNFSLSASKEFRYALSNSGVDEIKSKYARKLKTDAYVSKLREALTIDQIKSISEMHRGQKVAVVTGAIHTPISHVIGEALPMKRTFVGPAGSDRQKVSYSPIETAMRAFNMRPDKELSDENLGRALLEMVLLQYGDYHASGEIARSIPKEDLESEIETAISEYRRLRTLHMMRRVGRNGHR